jgi:hypothetical protein
MTGPYKRLRYKETQREDHVKMEAEIKWCFYKSKKDRRGKQGVSSRPSRENMVLYTPWPKASGLSNCERINFYYFRSPSLSWFVTTVIRN